MAMESTSVTDQTPWFLKSSYPVLLPEQDALTMPEAKFESFLVATLNDRKSTDLEMPDAPESENEDNGASETLAADSENETAEDSRESHQGMTVDLPEMLESEKNNKGVTGNRFMSGLVKYNKDPDSIPDEKRTRTANGDLAYKTTSQPLVDLFHELEGSVSGPALDRILAQAWRSDDLSTLKIIFNARSIHLGKSSRNSFYRCAGWLAKNHPRTLVSNLRWLSRPVVEKKTPVKKEGEDDMVMVEEEKSEDDPSRFDVKYGVSHGYWKDLLNILVIAVNGKLDGVTDPSDLLKTENPGFSRGKRTRRQLPPTRGGARGGRGGSIGGRIIKEEKPTVSNVDPKESRHQVRDERYKAAVKALKNTPFYRALHLTVARLFAEQLQQDLKMLRSPDARAKRNISLCGKWAPSHDHFHDRHTFIISSIAEIMYPRESLDERLNPTDDREKYVRYAREQYRKDTSALRKHLEIVERDITANAFDKIKYERVPSLAMNNYSKLFIEKDLDRFEEYTGKVASNRAKISGATLLPSELIGKTQAYRYPYGNFREKTDEEKKKMDAKQLMELKVNEIESKVLDGQWNTLVQRIRDSGNLESSIAVCDVSGSMASPRFSDGTTPMAAAVGLSLLVAEVTKPPFGGAFITFSDDPTVQEVDLKKSLNEKVRHVMTSDWGGSTNIVSVFEDLILPMAIKNKLTQDEMVKRVFVFSDMHFNMACRGQAGGGWGGSFAYCKELYEKAGYELPELVFWDLAARPANIWGASDAAPKPVDSTAEGTCLVSGYSQAMLKVFLENGGFEEEDEDEDESEDEEVVVSVDGNDNVTMKETKATKKMDPLTLVKKAIGHTAYSMLKVVD